MTLNRAQPGRSFISNDHFDYCSPRNRLLFPDRSRIAPKRKEWRPRCRLRRSREPDRIRPARRGIGSFPGNNLVGHRFHADVNHAFDSRRTPNRPNLGALGSKDDADKIANRNTAAVRTADCSAKSGADPEIIR